MSPNGRPTIAVAIRKAPLMSFFNVAPFPVFFESLDFFGQYLETESHKYPWAKSKPKLEQSRKEK